MGCLSNTYLCICNSNDSTYIIISNTIHPNRLEINTMLCYIDNGYRYEIDYRQPN